VSIGFDEVIKALQNFTYGERVKIRREAKRLNRVQNNPTSRKKQKKKSFISVPNVKKKVSVNYKEYINSPEWESKKRKFYKSTFYHGHCEICHRKLPLDIHHLSYDNLGNEPLTDLMAVCRECHKIIHLTGSKKILKRTYRVKEYFRNYLQTTFWDKKLKVPDNYKIPEYLKLKNREKENSKPKDNASISMIDKALRETVSRLSSAKSSELPALLKYMRSLKSEKKRLLIP
jgi:5-methylcytosine-specific restriction endonuclease McrA